MRFRKLRIAWSVAWGLACVLLIVLWVRSYWKWDFVIAVPFQGAETKGAESYTGTASLQSIDRNDPPHWSWSVFEIDEDALGVFAACRENTHFGFGVEREGNRWAILVPHWFLLLLAAAVAVAPWLRFSLRTLLIATTLVALVLGIIAVTR
jgi:hypothetical protein